MLVTVFVKHLHIFFTLHCLKVGQTKLDCIWFRQGRARERQQAVLTAPVLNRQLDHLEALVEQRRGGLVGGVRVLRQVRVSQRLLSRRPQVGVQLQHLLQQVDRCQVRSGRVSSCQVRSVSHSRSQVSTRRFASSTLASNSNHSTDRED